MLMKSLCRVNVPISIWSHNVLPAHSLEASVDIPPAPNIVNDDQKLAEEAGEGGWDHYKGSHSQHITFRKSILAREIQGLFYEDESKDERRNGNFVTPGNRNVKVKAGVEMI